MHNEIPAVDDQKISDLIRDLFNDSCAVSAYSRTIPELAVPDISEFYGVHLAIWQLREHDLQSMFPLYTAAQRKKYLAWCVTHGLHEYRALCELEPFWGELSKPAIINSTEWSGGVSRLLQLLIFGRPDLAINPDLDTAKSQESALAWFFCQGGFEETDPSARPHSVWQRAFFLGEKNLEDSKFATLIHTNRQDIQRAFNLKEESGRKEFKSWLINHASVETGLKILIQPQRRAWPAVPGAGNNHVFGVNLIGYAYGELGIGEDVRMAAHSMLSANIPFTIINISPGENIRQADRSVEPWVGEEPLYMFNVICLTALEHLRVYLEQGTSLFDGRYNIGYWPWELHHWPDSWKHCFNLVDEVWASSRHIERAMRAASDVTVRYMPMAVKKLTFESSKASTRAQYRLPTNDTLFVFSFDGNSYIERKNPTAIVEAFNTAFPSKTENACLVIKCMRPDGKNPNWNSIVNSARLDKRIIIIDSMLKKDEVMALYEACDCFVSLHRAEGFGRGIAEAILLNLDVIATNYGGNTEFCQAAQTELVPFELIPVKAGEYVEHQGNYWAEPNIQAAANAMRSVALKKKTKKSAQEILAREQLLQTIFSPGTIGARYKNCLTSLSILISE